MKKLLTVCIAFISVLACSKNNNNPTGNGGNPTGDTTKPPAQTTYQPKTVSLLEYVNLTAALPYDSLVKTYTYDAQGRISGFKQHEWNNGSVSDATVMVTYNNSTAAYVAYQGSSTVPYLQYIFYLNTSSLIDSAVHQVFLSNAWQTYEREKYTYANGYAATADTTFYNVANIKAGTSHDDLKWTNGDLDSVINKTSSGDNYITVRGYNSQPPAPITSDLTGPLFVKGITLSNNFPKTGLIIRNGVAAQNWTFTFTTDNLNRIVSSNWVVTIPSTGQSAHAVNLYTY